MTANLGRELAALKRERDQRRTIEQQRHEGGLRTIIDAEDKALADLDTATDAQLAPSRRELDDAHRQLAEAIAEAKRKRDALHDDVGPPRRGPGDVLAGLDDRLAGIGVSIARKITVTGTFDPIGVQGRAARRTRLAELTLRTP